MRCFLLPGPRLLVGAVCWCLCGAACQEGLAQGSAADYQRAAGLWERYRDRVFGDEVDPHWTSPTQFWFRAETAPGLFEVRQVDAETGVVTKLESEPPAGEPLRPWQAPRRRGRQHSRPRRESPDGRWLVERVEHNLQIKDTQTGDARPATTDGTALLPYDGTVVWSPDSKCFVAMVAQPGGDRRVFTVESSPSDQLQPKLHSYGYLKPGDPIPQNWPCLVRVEPLEVTPIDRSLCPNPWELGQVRWSADSSRFTFYYNQRGHQVTRLVEVRAEDGAARVLIDEQSPTFVDYAHKQFTHWLDDEEVLWLSERDGWNHLYLFDANKGELKRQVTSGSWLVRGVEYVDEKSREVWFWAGGIDSAQDPYYLHLCRVSIDTGDIVRLTTGDGTHRIQYSPDRRWLIDTYSRVDLPAITELRRASDGELVCELSRGDATPLLAAGWRPPERFVAKGRDGETDIFGVLYFPSNFDPARKYPVVEELYAGPQGAFVPKGFFVLNDERELAELGFVVVQIDGMGTSYRSKAFHDVCAKNLVDSGLPDRKLWLAEAAKKWPQMDLTRVGVKGHSAGAQSALAAVLHHSDLYDVAIAGCGCHDNRMDKIWWNELWMGWPVGPHYAEQSNVTNAHKLRGKLLLIVGELDDNVDPASTLQVVDALIKADKDFDLLVIPGRGHNTGMPYTKRRKWDFLVRHLLGVEPRWVADTQQSPGADVSPPHRNRR